MAASIGILVFLLKLKGNKIHALQVQLLKEKFKTSDQLFQTKIIQSNTSVITSKANYENSLNNYEKELKVYNENKK